jgi:hypothetical protein
MPLVISLQLGDDHRMGNVAASGRAITPASEEVLEIAPRIYREYASEFGDLARGAMSESQREMWHDAAKLFEYETGHFKPGRQ